VIEQAALLIKLHKEVDVAVGAAITPRCRTEYPIVVTPLRCASSRIACLFVARSSVRSMAPHASTRWPQTAHLRLVPEDWEG
jgi:hypothetical protein